jgi:hypothetical protein
MDKQRPNTESGNINVRSGIEELASKRARIAAKARTNPKERFTNLIHHLSPELIKECLKSIPKKSAVGTDGVTRDVAVKNLSWVLPPTMEDIHLLHQ